MKRFLAIILAGLMLLSFAACGEKKNEMVVKMGVLEGSGMEKLRTEEHWAHVNEKPNDSSNVTIEFVNYNNLSAALMDLEAGKIVSIALEECTAEYIAARNEKIVVSKTEEREIMTNFSMMTMENNKEVYDILNNAIVEMKADGTLDRLIENELKAYIESDPVAKDLPHFDGAKTIKIGVTGDVPPMDFIAANGKAAGFNIALLTEIANRAQVNIELVQIETGSRPMALSSGKVDAVFWTKSNICGVCGAEGEEEIKGTLITESYFFDHIASIARKSAK
jgi:polar amino acid transport system substrate-binding protein